MRSQPIPNKPGKVVVVQMVVYSSDRFSWKPLKN